MYGCKFIFDGCKMYVSGDIGEAVFCFTEKVDVHTFNDYNINYFESKLRALSEDRRTFESTKAVKRLRHWLNELKEDQIDYDHDEMKELFDEVRECGSKSEWRHIIQNHEEFISEIEPDYWEWIDGCGDEIPIRVHSYLIALQMAWEKLKVNTESPEKKDSWTEHFTNRFERMV
jgi:hypothetical protein